MAYLAVLSLVCLSVFSRGHHHWSSVHHNDTRHSGCPATTHIDADETGYKELQNVTNEAGTQPAKASQREAGTQQAEASWHGEAGTQPAAASSQCEAGTQPAVVSRWRGVHAAWLLLMLLLARVHNIPLVAVMTLQHTCCRHIVKYLCRYDDCISPVSLSLIYLFAAHAAFFYQV